MTERLYYNDSYLTEFSAALTWLDSDGRHVRLSRTAFYPASGGQPADTGTLNGVAVVDVLDEREDVVHVLDRPIEVRPGTIVRGIVDRDRRCDHVQQHTEQHLLSAVLMEIFGWETLSFHMGAEGSTIELASPAIEPSAMEAAELRCNALIAENRPVTVSFEDAAVVEGLRKSPQREGMLRVITIEGLDRSACGGTHVRATGEIGCVLLRSTERIRGNTRLSFLCGLRAVRTARGDYNALSAVARIFSAALSDVPRLAASAVDRLAAAEKDRAKLTEELAAGRGRELHAQTAAIGSGLRLLVREYPEVTEEGRAVARSFVECGRAVFVGICETPPSIMVAASSDSGVHAGNILKTAVGMHGGRGGGSATAAQGSAPDAVSARMMAEHIEAEVRRIAEQR